MSGVLEGAERRQRCIEAVVEEGELFGVLAQELAVDGRLDVPVPWIAAWSARELVGHVGTVHRWTTHILRAGTTEQPPRDARPAPPGEGLLEWYGAGLAGLVGTLREVAPDAPCWHMSPAASRTADDWARRQAHELVVHRMDLEAAAGAAHAPVDVRLAEDGVDELLGIVLPRWAHTEPLASARTTVTVASSDTGRSWTVRLDDGAVRVTPERMPGADAHLEGSATGLLLRLWGRPVDDVLPGAVSVSGDPAAEALLRGR
jgi:uncharacterized protein (TIGR03083 family)